MIPAWKLRRELARLGQQLRGLHEAVWEPFARRRHDAALARGFAQFDGAVPAGRKIALVLCWQPKGIAASFLGLLDHLVACGYAPLVISNAPLSAGDRQALQSRVWRAVERPNFGYDFGGYRDGLILLRRWGLQPDRLVILNDSIWFPLWPGDQMLQRAEQSDFDVTGTILRQRGEIRFLESYFFSIRGPVLDHPGFRAFWDGLRLTSNKYKVIRRGERGFGQALQRAGLSLGALFPAAAFDAAVAQASEAGLRDILRHMASADPAERAAGAALAASGAGAEPMRAFIAKVLRKAQPYSAFPVVAARHLGYPVLKKSAEPVSYEWRAAFLRAVEDGVLPPPQEQMLAEIRARTKETPR